MLNFLEFIYNFLAVPFLYLFIKIFKGKFATERAIVIKQFYNDISSLPDSQKRVWIHSSSMGEFEQAKPLIELIKQNNPELCIICTFFSPSGYLNQIGYKFADYLSYIPFDSRKNAEKFLSIVNPNLIIFVRYDLWINFLDLAQEKGIKQILINATAPGLYPSFIYKIAHSFYKNSFNHFDAIFAFNKSSMQFFENKINHRNVILSSDTRLDRIASIVESTKFRNLIPDNFIADNTLILVAGSTWDKDADIIGDAIKTINQSTFQLKVIFVPHKPDESTISHIESLIPDCIRFSRLLADDSLEINIEDYQQYHLIVDSIGLLLQLYKYADIAYVGCGFGDGVHSTAEPAGYGIPIITGPNISKSPDALALNKNKALSIINNSQELILCLKELINNKIFRLETGKSAKKYINDNKGSSATIADFILKSI